MDHGVLKVLLDKAEAPGGRITFQTVGAAPCVAMTPRASSTTDVAAANGRRGYVVLQPFQGLGAVRSRRAGGPPAG
ncbi:unnamed protein product [Boreogadus saida]